MHQGTMRLLVSMPERHDFYDRWWARQDSNLGPRVTTQSLFGRLGKHVTRKGIWVVQLHRRDRFFPGRFYLERQADQVLEDNVCDCSSDSWSILMASSVELTAMYSMWLSGKRNAITWLWPQ